MGGIEGEKDDEIQRGWEGERRGGVREGRDETGG